MLSNSRVRLVEAAAEYMGITPDVALSSHSREACTARQFVAYVMIHKMGMNQSDVAAALHITQGTVSRSVHIVKSYDDDPTTREPAHIFVQHLYKFV